MSTLRQAPRSQVMSDLPGSRSADPLTSRELVPMSELVLVDKHEAQGWRVRQDERLDHLFEARCDWVRTYGRAGQLAVDSDELSLTYDELDARANQVARYLRLHGAGAGDRIGLLFDRPADSYIAMLAVLKIGAAYVPLDTSFPTDRMAYIVEDAHVRTVLTTSDAADRIDRPELLTGRGTELVSLDLAERLIDEQNSRRLIDAERGILDDQLAYIIYTSGANGRLRGVAVDHPSICNFVKVAAEVYGIQARDRVYQGLTIAFDLSVEEIWVPWACGATLVPRPSGASLLGRDLHAFLSERRVTAMSTVPTLLATIEDELPDLRFLLVAGEPCPQELTARWQRAGRRLLSVYGPAEATVTATWTELHPDKPATIGIPLPTYSTVILDVEDPHHALPHGEIGEIGIAGIGLSCGYLNRDDLTDAAFIPDFLGLPANPSGRIYRTGDLGRVNVDGEIEYHGRVDQQGAMRGYRSELAELELLLRVPGLAQAVPAISEPAVAPSPPSTDVEPSGAEKLLAEALAEVLGIEHVPADAHFFDDLGADSMVMARFCARARKRADLPTVAMQDIYKHSTITNLATALAPAPASEVLATAPGESSTSEEVVEALPDVVAPVGRFQYFLCGLLQLLVFLGYSFLTAVGTDRGIDWVSAGVGLAEIYQRSVLFGAATFLGLSVLPILAKWVLIGRWKPQQIRVWSLSYVRFWTVKLLIKTSPLALFAGSPIYLLYLRALGAKVGRGVAIFSRNLPVCTDLLTIGDGTVIRKDSFFSGYRAHSGVIQTGAVTLGKDVFVGEQTVIDIGASMGDGSQLGHSSSLHTGQAVPAGERWHGSRAQRTEVNYRRVEVAGSNSLRKVGYTVLQLLSLLLVGLPLVIGGAVVLFTQVPQLGALLEPGPMAFTTWAFYRDVAAASVVLFVGLLIVGLLLLVVAPRLLNLAITPDKVYRLYGFHYWAHKTITALTNLKFFPYLFGDSSAIVNYLRVMGYDLSRVEQTGSNFGQRVKHESPFLSSVGTGTVIADGLSILNADFSNTSFRVSRASIGAQNFLGNNIAYPAQGRTGDNCLLATKVMVPIDGEIREGVGLLGSPSFEIPRSVQRDIGFDLESAGELRSRLTAKNWHNTVTMGLYLLVRWFYVFAIVTVGAVAAELYHVFGPSVVAIANLLVLLTGVAFFVLVERAVTRLQALRPDGCSIYDRSFWRHERFWKVPATAYLQIFNGTPFKSMIWRLLGVRLGARVFDDGCAFVEKTFVSIGDHCTLNAGSIVQCHSQEDGAFKSDLTKIGSGVTLGVGSFVHYGVTIGDGAEIAADSFLMKGEEVPPRTLWGANPARELRGEMPVLPECTPN
ncbi:amino acid adenylation domain-containing protein [Pseudonocardia alaniniphila]|uniref:Amino acid adenylation domain-containing protein n=1 Tax=Pseudonocardia alaniniphila TaxID=75291 RepID=A0ABS9TS18_9PSEU|nr:Pls/PosA family non-ribosomal peptide synthetase [Pseudonocardia alaniniphila]MCH6171325.1 amino acid adenylation domain-containing protein [Pseudonocardia alaniniphila]